MPQQLVIPRGITRSKHMASLRRCSNAVLQLAVRQQLPELNKASSSSSSSSIPQQIGPCFGHLRTLATSGISSTWKDRIHLRGIKCYGFHGALPEENVVGQPFEVDATVFCDLKAAGRTDSLTKTINYAEVYSIINNIMTGPPRQLLENVAESICKQVLDEHPAATAVQVHVRKLCIPAVPAVLQSVGIEVARTRDDYEG